MKILIRSVSLKTERTPWNKGNKQTEVTFRTVTPSLKRGLREELILNSSKASNSDLYSREAELDSLRSLQ